MKDLQIVGGLERGKKIGVYGESQRLSLPYQFFPLCDR